MQFFFIGCDVLPRKTKEDSQMTRNRLLDAALDVFSEKSFADVTLSEIAERVGMTKGALYWHFKNKNIFSEVWRRYALMQRCSFRKNTGNRKLSPTSGIITKEGLSLRTTTTGLEDPFADAEEVRMARRGAVEYIQHPYRPDKKGKNDGERYPSEGAAGQCHQAEHNYGGCRRSDNVGFLRSFHIGAA
jgi:AcrR family transcriptional regulator